MATNRDRAKRWAVVRRCVYVLGITPVAVYAGLRWIVTGEDAEEYFQRFVEWGRK